MNNAPTMPMVTGSDLKKASLMQKIINALSVVAFVLAITTVGGGVYGWMWINTEENQEKIKQQVIDSVMQNIPIPGGLTGPALPTKTPGKTTGKIGLPSF
jgi:hypothetical protein